MTDSTRESSWMNDYYGHAPFPGGRFVDRVPVAGALQPWTTDVARRVSQRWLGPVQIGAQGAVFNVRYVGIHEHFGSGRYPLHVHPHSELLFTLAGQGAIHVPERQAQEECRPGQLVALPPGCAHQSLWSVRPNEPWQLLIVDFDLALDVGQSLTDAGETADLAFAPFYEHFYVRDRSALRLDAEDRAPALEIMHGIARALALRQYGVCADIVAGLLRAISLFSRALRRSGLAAGRHLAPPALSKDAVLLKARALLEQVEMPDAGCVSRIARTVGMSRSHFIREFSRACGKTPKQYRLDVLMRRAASLMAQTDVPVKRASFQLGYGDPTSFTRAFRRYFGQAPADYRRLRRRAANAESASGGA